MPRPIEPRRGLKAGTKQPGRRKCTRKRDRVRHNHQRREEIAAGEDEEGAPAVGRELREQQHRGDQVGYEYDASDRGNESIDLRKRNTCERGEERERRALTYGDGDHPSRLPTCRRQAQEPRLGASWITSDHRCPLATERRTLWNR